MYTASVVKRLIASTQHAHTLIPRLKGQAIGKDQYRFGDGSMLTLGDAISAFPDIDVNKESSAYRSNRAFPGWYQETPSGGTFVDEWYEEFDCKEYTLRVVGFFSVIKGDLPEDDELPWHDTSNVIDIEII